MADGKWSHQHATPTTPELGWCILRRDVAIIGPNGNRCCVPWDMASLAQHAGCQTPGSQETSCWFSSACAQKYIRNYLSGTMLETASTSLTEERFSQLCTHESIQRYHVQLFHMGKNSQRKTQIASLNIPDIATFKITSERPGEMQNNFLTSAKTVGAKAGFERLRILLCIASV